MKKQIRFSAFTFNDLAHSPFSPEKYSRMKHGSNTVAREFGYALADAFFHTHSDILLTNKCVVIPSPYNFVKNAATIMTEHFINRLNHHLTQHAGSQVEYSIIHRKVSYINDYGFLSKEKRKGLIDNDSFYLIKEFYKGKVLIFVDDVLITGTHEEKLKEILLRDQIKNQCLFVYYAQYTGNKASIESEINLAAIKTTDDYVKVLEELGHQTIVRTIKYFLSMNETIARQVLNKLTDEKIKQIYFGCLGEGYYKIPSYQKTFQILLKEYETLPV